MKTKWFERCCENLEGPDLFFFLVREDMCTKKEPTRGLVSTSRCCFGLFWDKKNGSGEKMGKTSRKSCCVPRDYSRLQKKSWKSNTWSPVSSFPRRWNNSRWKKKIFWLGGKIRGTSSRKRICFWMINNDQKVENLRRCSCSKTGPVIHVN